MTDLLKIFLFLWLLPFHSPGQIPARADKMLEKATLAYQSRNYAEAISLTEKILKQWPGHLNSCLLMADIYHDLDSLDSEIFWLREASQLKKAPPLAFFRLGEAWYKWGNYPDALQSFNRLQGSRLTPGLQNRLNRMKSSCEFAIEAMKMPVRFKPEDPGENINTANDEYWPNLTIDGRTLIFTRLLPVQGNPVMKQEDFYSSVWDSAGWGPALPLTGLNTPMNEGAQSVSADGKLLFFTLCNHPGGFGSCDIWFSRLENGKWSTPRNCGEPVNTAGWEGQPSFSAFGDMLYFSSSRPGGKGNKDLWRVKLKGWNDEGYPQWNNPVNLGDSVNSPGEEISPFIHPNGKDLYFCSDYWPGFGGLDLFHSTEKNDGTRTRAVNLGYPINSPGNEQGLVIDRTGLTGWFATSRSHKGNMDIYCFETDEQFRPEPVSYIRGKVVNIKTGLPVPALVEVTGNDKDKPVDIKVRPDEKGIFLITLPPDQDLSFNVNEKGFLFYSERFRLTGNSSALEPVERQIALVPVEPGKSVDLYNIFFATNEFVILPGSEPELNTLLGFLKDNPSLSVEIGGHTDNVGTPEFNRRLSEKRALSVRQYLTERGISAERLFSHGYGMDKPVAPNDTEENRALNRRTTLKIVD